MILKYPLLLLLFMAFACKSPQQDKGAVGSTALIPLPNDIQMSEGVFLFSKTTSIYIESTELKEQADFYIERLKDIMGISIEVSPHEKASGQLQLRLDQNLDTNDEGYMLSITPELIKITGKTSDGLANGWKTLLQLFQNFTEKQSSYRLQALSIKDQPRFPWRGIHLDVSRHFFDVATIKKQLDVLAQYKINKFHWHLTDDQGWRIEIKKYPRLTQVGATRTETAGRTVSGFYTQEEVKDIVAFAKARGIEVIPEIEMPGHALAALAAYPELGCAAEHYKPRETWGIEKDIFCVGKDSVFDFLKDVLDEVIPLFPSQYIHIGGDEVPKENWEECPACLKRLADEGLNTMEELQGYFINRMGTYLKTKNRRIIGWDEILEGTVDPESTIMSWQGEEGGIHAANAGHDVIMTPTSVSYFNFYEGDPVVEPMAFGGDIPLQKVYDYDPVPAAVDPANAFHILGAQGNLWTEYIYDASQMEYQLYPRMLAMAETTWIDGDHKDFYGFFERLKTFYPVLEKQGVNFHIPIPEGPQANKLVFVDSLHVGFHTTPSLNMVYTLDGSEPDLNSEVYRDSLVFKESITLHIASLLTETIMSPVRYLTLEKQIPAPAEEERTNLVAGLDMKTYSGFYTNVKDLLKSPVQSEKIIKEIKDANTVYEFGLDIDRDKFGGFVLEGFIELPETAVYHFSSTLHEVWINDRPLLINPNEVVRRPFTSEVALEKGLHSIKIIFLNTLIKGWPTDWNPIDLNYRKSIQDTLVPVTGKMLFTKKQLRR